MQLKRQWPRRGRRRTFQAQRTRAQRETRGRAVARERRGGRGRRGQAGPRWPPEAWGFVQSRGKVARVRAAVLVEITQARCGEHGGFKERMKNSQRPSWLRDLAGPRPRVRVRGLARRPLCPGCPHLPALPTAHTQLKSQRAQGRKFDVFMTAQNGKN